MDLNAGFWQIGMAPEDKEKTAFLPSFGLYQFTVMPFGLVNSPSSFERLMEDVLRGLQWKELLLYMEAALYELHSTIVHEYSLIYSCKLLLAHDCLEPETEQPRLLYHWHQYRV
jgi:hypothetical protein